MPSEDLKLNLGALVVDSISPGVSIPVSFTPSETLIDVKSSLKDISFHKKLTDYFQAHSTIVFALIILSIALVSRPVVINSLSPPAVRALPIAKHSPTFGLNTAVPKQGLATWLNSFVNQPASLNLGTKTVPIDPALIKSWLSITSAADSKNVAVHLNTALVKSSITALADKYNIAPTSQVTAARSDGSSEIAVYGRNGSQLSDPTSIAAQAQGITKNLFSNQGFQINAPLVTVPFQNVTPASFNKLILVDVNSKVMYLYQDGKIVNTYPVSAGAPATPTPIGEFHIYEKLPLQNMSGYNVNGTKYFQPNVEWINYFDGADAVHGVYWHPLSWFGVHNSSHGCVGISDANAEWVYNWAPIGTTVITTPN